MSDLYEVRLYDTAGVLLHVFDSWRSLSCDIRINDFSTHVFSIDANDHRVPDFTKDCFFQVRRQNLEAGLDWYTEYIGFHRTYRYELSPIGNEIFTSYGRSLEDLLRRRVLAYPIPYNRSGPADSVMTYLVNENASNQAIAPRFANGVIPNFTATIIVFGGLGPNWEGERSGKNLLEVLKEMAESTGVDFNVVWIPPNGFEFLTYFPQLGTDHTQSTGIVPIVFGAEFGNVLTMDHTISATEEGNRVFLTNNSLLSYQKATSAIGDSPFNICEVVRDIGSNTPAQFDSLADSELTKNAARESVALKILQIPSAMYGKHYVLGDLVSMILKETVIDIKIVGVHITESGDTHDLTFSFGELEPAHPIDAAFRNVVRRLRDLEAKLN